MARWSRFFGSHPLVDRYFSAAESTAAEQAAAQAMLARWRDYLSSLTWFMWVFNETLARRANAEDACGGRFWGRRKGRPCWMMWVCWLVWPMWT